MKIAVDGMGGDHAPREIIAGCIQAVKEFDVEVVVVGREYILRQELERQNADLSKIEIRHAEEIITNEDKPVQAVRSKKNSSIIVGLNLVKQREVDAFVSAGNTGALLAGSIFRVGRIKGVDRPAIASVYPTSKGISLLIDAGANAECRPRNLLEFGLMGTVYVEKVLGLSNPTVGLVNIGAEEGKGTDLVKESHRLLSESSLNYIGSAEARDLPSGVVDIIVCDGFVGNVVLKLTEGVAMTLMSMMKEKFTKNLLSKLGATLLMGSLKEFKKQLDYTEYGGAPLLGINGVVIKAHGSSNAKAIKNAIKQAKATVENQVVQIICDEIIKIGVDDNEK